MYNFYNELNIILSLKEKGFDFMSFKAPRETNAKKL